MTIADEILRVTGEPDKASGLAFFFSKTATESLQDAEKRWLFEQIEVTVDGQINDMWYEYLVGTFGPGSVQDMKLAFWTSL